MSVCKACNEQIPHGGDYFKHDKGEFEDLCKRCRGKAHQQTNAYDVYGDMGEIGIVDIVDKEY